MAKVLWLKGPRLWNATPSPNREFKLGDGGEAGQWNWGSSFSLKHIGSDGGLGGKHQGQGRVDGPRAPLLLFHTQWWPQRAKPTTPGRAGKAVVVCGQMDVADKVPPDPSPPQL